MKVTVRIHYPTGLKFQTKKVEEDGRVTIKKGTKKQGGWRPLVKGIEAKIGWFGRTKFYADVFPDADETWKIDHTIPQVNQPKFTKDESTRYINKKILDRAGEDVKEKGSMGTMIIAILVIVGIVINILVSSGRLRI